MVIVKNEIITKYEIQKQKIDLESASLGTYVN